MTTPTVSTRTPTGIAGNPQSDGLPHTTKTNSITNTHVPFCQPTPVARETFSATDSPLTKVTAFCIAVAQSSSVGGDPKNLYSILFIYFLKTNNF